MNLSNIITNISVPRSNMIVKEILNVNLNYSPLILVNILCVIILFISNYTKLFDKLFKYKNDKYYFDLIWMGLLLFTNIFYLFTHFFPAIGFYI